MPDMPLSHPRLLPPGSAGIAERPEFWRLEASPADALALETGPVSIHRMNARRSGFLADNAALLKRTGQNLWRSAGKRRKALGTGIRIVLTLVLCAFLCRSIAWSSLLAGLVQADRALLLAGFVCGMIGLVISAYQWRGLLLAERIRCDLAELIELYLVGIAFSHFLPTGMGGDAVKALYTGRRSRNAAGAASAVVMSRVTGFFGMLLVAAGALLAGRALVSAPIVLWLVALSLLVGALIIGALLVTMFLPGMLWRRRRKYRFVERTMRFGEVLRAGLRRPRVLWTAILVGACFWMSSCLNYYCFAGALGIQAPLSFYFVAVPLISLIAFLPVSLNGFGLREGALISVFATIHVPAATALLLALFMDAQGLLFGLIGGCLYLTTGNLRSLRNTDTTDSL